MDTKPQDTTKLEPRVAKLEVGLDRLTKDVGDLVQIVRSQGTQMEGEIQKLVVAVTQAAGPRKTEWSVVISAILLIMAIGSAVFWPLNKITHDNKLEGKLIRSNLSSHIALDLHPVGGALISELETKISLKEELIDEKVNNLQSQVSILQGQHHDSNQRDLDELQLYRLMQ